MPVERANLLHLVHGRARLRIPARRGDGAFFRHLGQRLRAMDKVIGAATSAATASVVVHFVGDWPAVARAASRQGLFSIDAAHAPPSALSRISAPSMIAALGMTALGMVQVARKQSLPAAITLFWYAAQLAKGQLDSER